MNDNILNLLKSIIRNNNSPVIESPSDKLLSAWNKGRILDFVKLIIETDIFHVDWGGSKISELARLCDDIQWKLKTDKELKALTSRKR